MIFIIFLFNQAAVYNICLKTCDDGMDGTEVFPGYPDLIGDR
jgi:protein O-GlcNAcase/histone acetyltransferase